MEKKDKLPGDNSPPDYTLTDSGVKLGTEHWECSIHGEIAEVVRFSLSTKDEYVVCLWCIREHLKREGFKNITGTKHIA